jgi:predicted DNA-binding transcriptional regulator AlpA
MQDKLTETGSLPETLTVRIPTAIRLTGISRSGLYALIKSGEVERVKFGRATLIVFASLKHAIARRTERSNLSPHISAR